MYSAQTLAALHERRGLVPIPSTILAGICNMRVCTNPVCMYKQTTLQKLWELVSTTVYPLDDLESVGWFGNAMRLIVWFMHRCVGRTARSANVTYPSPSLSHGHVQMQGACPSDCIPLLHPNTKVSTYAIERSYSITLLLACLCICSCSSCDAQKKYDPAHGYTHSGFLQVRVSLVFQMIQIAMP